MSPVGGEPRFSIVVPVYNNRGTVKALLERIEWINAEVGGGVEAVIVIDGSPDDSADLLVEWLPKASFSSQLLRHSRNFGSFAAIATGLAACRGEFVAVMAADLQEPADLIVTFLQVLERREAQIVVGVRAARDDPGASTAMSKLFWRVYRRVVNPEIPAGGVDIFGCDRQVAHELADLREVRSSLVGLLYWVGYDRVEIPYERQPRTDGQKSGWSFRRKMRYMSDSIFSFTSLPIDALLAIGLVGTVGSLLIAVAVLLGRASGAIEVPGYTALMIVILVSTSLILLALGIVGTYVWRVFENVKGRPGSIVMTRESFGPDR
ncbi:MAG: glycosyltransferase family 2 protein [Actinomycetes bacterium]